MRVVVVVLAALLVLPAIACRDDQGALPDGASAKLDAAVSDGARPDAERRDAAVPDGGATPDAAVVPDAAVPPDDAVIPDAPVPPDAAVVPDAEVPPDDAVIPDAAVPPDAMVLVPSGIAEARASADGTGLALVIRNVTVTYLKPQIGSTTNDPAGFTIQGVRPGPALFVAVNPATLSPAPSIGDVVSFTITSKSTVGGQPRATALAGYSRVTTGSDVGALVQDLSTATDVVSALDSYDSELITVVGTVFEDFVLGGTGFMRAGINTAGITGNVLYQVRVPTTVIDALDFVKGCQLTAHRVPMGRFKSGTSPAQAQVGVYFASDATLANCPAPKLDSAAAVTPTSVQLTFSRRIAPGSVKPNGSQFTFDNGLVATSATVNGRTVTLTPSAQAGTTYKVTVGDTVTDLLGSPIAAPASASFFGKGTATGAGISVHTTMGIPSPSSTSDPNSYLSVKSEYVISYNSSRKVPNWVSWELNSSYIGSSGRNDSFRVDDTLPAGMPQAQLGDYSNSGYSRGHMCPSGERTWDVTANKQTFYLTNMVPQAANNNSGPWKRLEDHARSLASMGKEMFIISGGTFSVTSNTIGAGKVVVPDDTWKVVVVLDAVGQGPADVTTSTRVIAVLMPNENALIDSGADWRTFRVSVDQIEAATGYDFLSDVDPAIQAVIEARVDNQ